MNHFKRESIIKRGILVNDDLKSKLYENLEKNKKGFGSKFRNYFPSNLDLEKHLCFDVLVEEKSGEIVSGSGIYNGGRFPQGVFRVLNRSFVMPSFRHPSFFQLLNTRLLLNEQLEEYDSELKLVFVSREGLHAHQFLNWWATKFQGYFPHSKKWKIEESFVHVAPRSQKQSSYQRIAYSGDILKFWNPKTIEEIPWSQLDP